jgi:hypothetical protein
MNDRKRMRARVTLGRMFDIAYCFVFDDLDIMILAILV